MKRLAKRSISHDVAIVLGKELRDATRDRRSVFLTLFYGVFGPLIMLASIYLQPGGENSNKPAAVQVVGANYAPALIAHLVSENIDIQTPKQADQATGVVLTIANDFTKKIASGEPVEITLSGSRRDNDIIMNEVQSALAGYQQKLAVQRLILRGIPPVLLSPLKVEVHNTDESSAFAIYFSQSVVFFFLVACSSAGMSLAIDTTAGERERHSLEILLAQPVSRLAIVIGKWLTITCFGMAGIATCGLTFAILNASGQLAKLGIGFGYGFAEVPTTLLYLLGFAGFLAALQLLVGFAARSFKEAQAYIGFTMIVPILLSMLANASFFAKVWMKNLPVLFEVDALKHLLTLGNYVNAAWPITMIIEIVFTILLLIAATFRLNSGKMLPSD